VRTITEKRSDPETAVLLIEQIVVTHMDKISKLFNQLARLDLGDQRAVDALSRATETFDRLDTALRQVWRLLETGK
jgi:hypothetical protein